MLKENIWLYRRINLIIDLGLTALAFYLAASLRSTLDLLFQATFHPDYSLLYFVLPIWVFIFSLNQRIYEYRMVGFGETFKNVSLTLLKALGILLAVLYLTHRLEPSRATLIIFALLNFVFLLGFRRALSAVLALSRKKGYNLQKILLVGSGKQGERFVQKSIAHPQWGLKIVGLLDWNGGEPGSIFQTIPHLGKLSNLSRILQNEHVDYVVFAAEKKDLQVLDESIAVCEEMGAKAYLLADFFDLKIARQQLRTVFNSPALLFSTTPKREGLLFCKYVLDKIYAFILVCLSCPLMLAASLLIKLTSPGPVIFRQTRIGLNGRKFTLYKFRTMVQDAEILKSNLMSQNEMTGPVFKMAEDPRLTRVGKILRKSSIDELPQFFNVIKGDMSLVGPRPPLAAEVARYDRWQRRKLSIKPGLTCLWQVNGRNQIDFEHWMKMDLQYIDNWSFWLDAKILLKTVPAVISGNGAK
ncbi:MAG: sugar transferase [candidate division Zixibacteria bacterium]|nr:sugar transferase [candidate division Zixibacteria bacterium]